MTKEISGTFGRRQREWGLEFGGRISRIKSESYLRVVGWGKERECFRTHTFSDKVQCGFDSRGKRRWENWTDAVKVRRRLREGTEESKQGKVLAVREKGKASVTKWGRKLCGWG